MSEFVLFKTDCRSETRISYGNMFLIGNGHLGYRGTLEEYRKEQLVGLNIVGFYDRFETKWRESVNAPNPFYFRMKDANCLENQPLRHEIALDLKTETFSRFSEFTNWEIRSKRTVSQTEENVLLCEIEFISRSACEIDLTFGLDTEIYEINGPHFRCKSITASGTKVHFSGETNENKTLEMDVLYDVFTHPELEIENEGSLFHIGGSVGQGASVRIRTTAKIWEHKTIVEERVSSSLPFSERFEASQKKFEEKWRIADVEIMGNPEAQFALRYSIYHLLILGNSHYHHSIPARGVSGQTYKGAVFWDSEIFLYPFYLLTDPDMAKTLLEYRIQTLSGAMAKAKELGYEGAFYAWESQDSGLEACSKYNVTDPISHLPIRTYFNEKQIHISPDIVYTLDDYIKKTEDYDILIGGGYRVMEEVTRFLISYATLEEDGFYHLKDVIGPDEYHERIDDNAFTSYMSERAIRSYIAYSEWMASHGYAIDEKLCRQAKQFVDILYLPPCEENGRIEQFRGYFHLEDVDVETVRSRLRDPKEYWGSANGVATPTRVIKQADVLALMCLQKERFSKETIRKNYDFYYPYTEHGSSLSSSMYSQCACWIGKSSDAYRMFMKSATIDLGTEQKMFAGGIYIGGTHPASNGGSYLSVIRGFAGMTYKNGTYIFEPALPEQIAGLSFCYYEKNQLKRVQIVKDRVTVKEEYIYD